LCQKNVVLYVGFNKRDFGLFNCILGAKIGYYIILRGDNMVLSIADVIELKQKIEEQGNRLHFHDACGCQSFSLDSKCSTELKELIEVYFKARGAEVVFSEDGRSFVVK
jgi:hypothetical protein